MMVGNEGVGFEDDGESGPVGTAAIFEVFEIHKVAFIKKTNFFYRTSGNQHGSHTGYFDGDGGIGVGSVFGKGIGLLEPELVEGSGHSGKVKDGTLVSTVGIEEFGNYDAGLGLLLGLDEDGNGVFVFEGSVRIEEHDIVTLGDSEALVVSDGKASVVVVEDKFGFGIIGFYLFDGVISGGIVDDDDFEWFCAVVVDRFDGCEGERRGVEGYDDE